MRVSLLALTVLLTACASRPKSFAIIIPPNVPTPVPPRETSGPLPEAEEEEEDNLDILECPRHFETADRSKWHEIKGERYYVDSHGRPSKAETFFPPLAKEARKERCQGAVGRWGDAEDPKHDYDGGHMIGAQLGGWGARANMVPQETNLNTGVWKSTEDWIAKHCKGLDQGRLKYSVSVSYPTSTALVPDAMQQRLEDTESDRVITLKYANERRGGDGGEDMRDRGRQWLVTLGCE